MEQTLAERFEKNLNGVLNCYDRVVIIGNVQAWCYAKGMTHYLYQQNIRIFDYAKFAEPLRERIRANAEALAKEAGVEIEFVRKKEFRKEARIQAILKERGEAPGLVHIISAMEGCNSYKPWHDKPTGKTFLQADSGKCLHYYFYFMDEELGLCYLRVPTWAPFRLQFYFNGHSWLAAQLKANGIEFEMLDNAFANIADFEKANELAKKLDQERLSQRLNALANVYCPVVAEQNMSYYWSIMQAEYATDFVFKDQDTLQAFYPQLLETLTHAVKPADIATFLGRKLNGNYQGEIGNRFNKKRWLGTRIKHQMGPVSIKMYDKFGLILRIETTVNNVTFFKQYRQVEKRDGTTVTKWAPMKKTIFSLPPLQEVLRAANQRYTKFISSVATPEVGIEKLHHLAETKTENNHRYKGFNLFSEEDTCLFRTLSQGEFAISGFTNKQLRQYFAHLSASQTTRIIARLRLHGLIKKVAKGYKYYLTDLGRQWVSMALKLREMVIIPALALPAALQA